MKNILTGMVFLTLPLFANPLAINIGNGSDLAERVNKLEREITELRAELRSVREKSVHSAQASTPVIIMPASTQTAPTQVAPVASKTYSCFIVTAFNGTFTGKGTSLMEARGSALQACSKGGGGISCSESKLKCDE